MERITNFSITRTEHNEFYMEVFVDHSPVGRKYIITEEEFERFSRLINKPEVKRKRHKKSSLVGLFNFQEI